MYIWEGLTTFVKPSVVFRKFIVSKLIAVIYILTDLENSFVLYNIVCFLTNFKPNNSVATHSGKLRKFLSWGKSQ